MTDYLGNAFPAIAGRLPKLSIATLPTPVSERQIDSKTGRHGISIKHDDVSNAVYGGNKIRKLEYILCRAKDRGARRVATFGAVGSNHALATAIHARQLGLKCTAFLAHQAETANVAATLNKHLELGTEIHRYGGRVNRVDLFRRVLQRRRTWVVPLGGTCWIGIVGFINAGLELAEQIAAGRLAAPDRVYVANGTMGTVAGLSIGMALAGLPVQIHAVRVAENRFVRREVLAQLMRKTVLLLKRMDSSFPLEAANGQNITWRGEFFAGGYARTDAATDGAVKTAKTELDLGLETTYTGKAMAALLNDLQAADGERYLFWNTYNSRAVDAPVGIPAPSDGLPEEFLRYYPKR